MATPAEHYAEAERLLAIAQEADEEGVEQFALGAAQVHATLATVSPEVAGTEIDTQLPSIYEDYELAGDPIRTPDGRTVRRIAGTLQFEDIGYGASVSTPVVVAGHAPGVLSDGDLAELRDAVASEIANRPGFGEGR